MNSPKNRDEQRCPKPPDKTHPQGEDEQESQEQGETGEMEESDQRREEGEEAEVDTAPEKAEDMSEAEEADDSLRPNRQELFGGQENWGYKIYTTQFDEEISAPDLCDAEELNRLRSGDN